MVTEEEHVASPRLGAREIEKTLVSLAIEQTLLSISKKTLDEVGHQLFEKYKCDFSECLTHPEYLNDVLAKLFGKSHRTIMSSIYNNLQESQDDIMISDFLDRINQYRL